MRHFGLEQRAADGTLTKGEKREMRSIKREWLLVTNFDKGPGGFLNTSFAVSNTFWLQSRGQCAPRYSLYTVAVGGNKFYAALR